MPVPWMSGFLQKRYWLAFMLLAGAAVLSLAPGPTVDNSALQWIDADSAAAKHYVRFQRELGTDDVFVVSLTARDLPALLHHVEQFDTVLSDDPLIERVISLRSVYADRWSDILRLAEQSPSVLAERFNGPLTEAIRLLDTDKGQAILYGLSPLSTTEEKSRLEQKLHRQHLLAEKDGLTVRVAGNPLLNLALDRAGERVERRSLPILVLVCVVLMLLLTRSLGATLAVMVPAGAVVKSSEGLIGLTGTSANIVLNIAKPLLFVLLLAGTVHILVGWQDARGAGIPPGLAPWRAVRRKGRAVAFALGTTAIGFGSLVLSDVPPIRHFGLFSAAGLLGGIPFVLLVFPALIRFVKAPAEHDLGLGELSWRLCRIGLRGRWLFPLLGVGFVIAGVLISFRLHSDPHAIHYFEPDHHLRRDHEALEAEGLGLATSELVLTSSRSFLTPDRLRSLETLSRKLADLPGVSQVIDPSLLISEAAFRVTGGAPIQSAEQVALLLEKRGDVLTDFAAEDGKKVRVSLLIETLDAEELSRLRKDITAAFEGAFSKDDAELLITGNYEILLSTQAGLLQTLKSSLLLTVLLMTLLFILILRSFRIALLALLPNLFPVCLSFVLMYLFRMPLDVGTSMTAAIALGIAVDDTLHFALSWDPANPRRTAFSTGRAIILSSAIIGAGFVSLVWSDFIPTRNFGVLCAAAMLSALLADLLILPPLLRWATRTEAGSGAAPAEVPRAG